MLNNNFPTFVFNRLNWGISVGENTTAPPQKKKKFKYAPGAPQMIYITIITLFLYKNNIVSVRKSQPA
jgi:hypothetical protein